MVMVEQWSVFRRGTQGGIRARSLLMRALAPAQILAIAAHYSHESAFVTDVTVSGVRMRYFVPAHEMRARHHRGRHSPGRLWRALRPGHPRAHRLRTAPGELERR